MIKSVYKLDSRIKDISDIQSPLQYDDSFIGEVCYFANSMSEFEDLKICSKGTLSEYIEDDYSQLGCFTAKEFQEDDFFDYFIPEKLLKSIEKKYRPFTLREFLEKYKIGSVVTFREKDCEVVEQSMLIGFLSGDEDKTSCGIVNIGRWGYTLTELFKEYEIYVNGEWQPFGVEEKE